MAIYERLKEAIDILSSVAMVVVAGALVWSVWSGNSRVPLAARVGEDVKIAGMTIEAAKLKNAKGTGKLALIELSDFECAYCARHAAETFKVIDKEFIETGAITYIPFQFPIAALHRNAAKASEAAECAGQQGAYWRMHDRFFTKPSALTVPDLIVHAGSLDIDVEKFTKCLDGEMSEKVEKDHEEGLRLGVRGTPAFFFGRVQADGSVKLAKRISGAAPIEQFRIEIGELMR